jgi:hypothetical protein
VVQSNASTKLNVNCFQFLVAYQVVRLHLMSPDVQFLEDSLQRHIPEICFQSYYVIVDLFMG